MNCYSLFFQRMLICYIEKQKEHPSHNILKFQQNFSTTPSLPDCFSATETLWIVQLCMLCLSSMRLVPESFRTSQLLIPALAGTQTLYCSLRCISLRCRRRLSSTCGNIKPVSQAARKSDINLLHMDTKVKTATAPLV